MDKNNSLIIEKKAINLVCHELESSCISGKILYVSDNVVDSIYGDIVKKQIEKVGILKTEMVDNNTISYAMDLAERCIATDVKCIVGL